MCRYGEKHPNWKGGSISEHGYRKVYVKGRQLYEHRYIMEQSLKRPLLRSEQVHHLNGNKLDNRIENLLLLATAEEHRKYHLTIDKIFKRPCRVCEIIFTAPTQTHHICITCRTFTCKYCGMKKTQKRYRPFRMTFCSITCRGKGNIFNTNNPRKKK